MPQQSHFDRLVEQEQRAIVEALIKSAAQGEMARSAVLAGRHQGLQQAMELQRKAVLAGADPDDGDA